MRRYIMHAPQAERVTPAKAREPYSAPFFERRPFESYGK
jgi:hypothetical protein